MVGVVPAVAYRAAVDRGQIEQTMRRVGLVYIVGLLLQIRFDGRQVLFPFLAAAVAWLLRDLHPVVVTADERRSWAYLIGCAYVTAVLAFVALLPIVDPSGPTVVMAILLVVGTVAYVDLLRSWGLREGWADVVAHGRRARGFLFASLAVVVLLICAAYAFTDRLPDGGDQNTTLLGRHLTTAAILMTFLVVLAMWIPAMVALQQTSRGVRAHLKAGGTDPSAETDDPPEPAGT